jgi:anaerobic magnesium-protoporphyrin IX monomethyl ester cyclase
MKIIFVFPRFRYESGDPPLGIAYLASYIKKNSDWEIGLCDATFHHSFGEVENYLDSNKPDIMGIYLDTVMYNDAIKIIRYARKKGIFIVAGGPHPTILPESLIEEVDVVILGEAEIPLKNIIRNYRSKSFGAIDNIWFKREGRVIKNKRVFQKDSLDGYPFPGRNLLEMDKYIRRCHQFDSINPKLKATTMIGSRGCLYNCSFCQPTLKNMFGSSVRIRSPENMVAEIRSLKNDYKIDAVFFHDDTLTADKRWMIKFCKVLEESDLGMIFGCNTRIDTIDDGLLKTMYNAGFRELHIGIESSSQMILDKVYKKGIQISSVRKTIAKIKAIGFNVMCFFMVGAPTETKKEISDTAKFASSLPIDEISVSITNPNPKTDLYRLMIDGNYAMSKNFSDFDYYGKQGFHKGLVSLRDLKWCQRRMLFQFYASPKHWQYILKHITSMKGINKMLIKLKRFR